MQRHVAQMARYNAWANHRLYADAAALPAAALHRDVGVYFGSLFATLAHILKVDRAWAHLLGGGTLETLPAAPVPTDFVDLDAARRAQDALLIARLDAIDERWLDGPITFESKLPAWHGKVYHGTRAGILTHLFNHQTHHRGQAHTALSLLGVAEPQALDLLVMGFLEGSGQDRSTLTIPERREV